MMTSHPKQYLFELPDKKPAVCKAILNVSFYYVGDYTDFWLQ